MSSCIGTCALITTNDKHRLLLSELPRVNIDFSKCELRANPLYQIGIRSQIFRVSNIYRSRNYTQQ